jgi:Ca2+-binding EF-hand superfamily protein
MTKEEQIEDLFNKLDWENNLKIWVNNMVKYGNMFDYDLDPEA